METTRWTDLPFPAYSYVTGKFPHPLREAGGHGCPSPSEPTFAPTTDGWQECKLYLWGVDLFNAGYYWESHEAWEGVWHAAGRKGPIADLQKSLIKLAAAGVKAREGRVEGVRRHAKRSAELAREIAHDANVEQLLGVNLRDLSRLGQGMETQATSIVKSAADVAAVVLPPLRLKAPINR